MPKTIRLVSYATTPHGTPFLEPTQKCPKPIKAIIIYNYYIKSNSIYPDNYTCCSHPFHSLKSKTKEVHIAFV